MEESDSVESQLALGRTLARMLPEPVAGQPPAAMPVAGAATRALKWLGDATAQLLAKALGDDCDGFLHDFEDASRRIRALEPVVVQLRPRWAAVTTADDAADGDRLSSGHMRLYQWCREVSFTSWAAACPKKLRAATTLKPGSLPELDHAPVRAHWPTVRQALAAMACASPEPFYPAVEAELSALLKAIQKPLANKKVAASRIPHDHLSRRLGKAEAAKLHSGGSVADPAAYFNDLVAREIINPPIGSGRQWQFDLRDFPASKRDQMR